MNLFKKTLIIFFYILLIIYSLEIFTNFFIKEKKNLTVTNIDKLKIEAINKIPNFDKRKDFQAFNEEKKNHDIYPSFRLSIDTINKNTYLKNFLKEKIFKKKKIPFRGPINKMSLGSNEEGLREIIYNDKYGFKNYNKVYQKDIDLMIIGDSFAEGVPFGNNYDVSGIINLNSNFNSINYGVSGTGPLHSLGVLTEYGKYFKPRNVFYFFYEGNDLRDLILEKNTFLKSYLEDNFSQNLFNSELEIKFFLNDFEELFFEYILDEMIKKENNSVIVKINKNSFIEIFKDIIELQNLKRVLIPKDAYLYKNKKLDYDTFEKSIIKMNQIVDNWGGKFHLVYLPSWSRYNNNLSFTHKFFKNKIKKITKRNNIDMIDMDYFFKKKKLDNANLFNLGIYGHYTQEGYKILADKILDNM